MPWVVGIDEAGYGPNLGPLVQVAVAVRLPDHDPAGWETLRPCVRRCCDPDDERLLIDDSKKVYAGPGGLAGLEVGALSAFDSVPPTLNDLLGRAAPGWCRNDLAGEAWFAPACPLPVCGTGRLTPAARLSHVGAVRAHLVPAARFNTVVDESGSKATVLSRGLTEIAAATAAALPPGERVVFHCDKHGGRNFYAAMLQHAFPDGWVVAVKESATESRYRIANLDREVEVVFRPRADAESVAVALASMTAKYLREVCMMQFNAFWAKHVPGLKPTAGYPGDAKRFYDAIRPAMDRLGLPADAVWRKR
jgi:hypothetical protein